MMRARREGGFTLLEILVVLVIFSLLSLTLWTGIGVGTRGWATSERTSDATRQAQETEEALRRLIQRADRSDKGLPPAFGGLSDRLKLIAWMPQGKGYDHEIEVGLGVNAAHAFVLRWRRYVRTRCLGPNDSYHQEVLMTGVRGVTFMYAGIVNGQLHWRHDWTTPQLPPLVRVHFDFVKPGRSWPDIMVHPWLSGGDESY